MPLALEKRLSLMAEASNLMLAGSVRAYGRNPRVTMRRRPNRRKTTSRLPRYNP